MVKRIDIKEKLDQLNDRKIVMVAYLEQKMDEEDWHGVQDAASDLRDIESEIKAWKEIKFSGYTLQDAFESKIQWNPGAV